MTGLPGIEVPRRAGVEERLAAMVRIETVTAPDDAAAFAEFPKLLAELYPLVHSRLESRTVVERGILLRWPAASTEQREAVVLMAHWDVVPAVEADGWSTPPFAGTIADGTVWGRGTLDDKGQLCVLLEAVENLLAAGVTPKRDIYLCLGGNEESYGDANRAIAADFQARAVMPWLVLDEGGAVVDAPMPQVPVPAAMVGVAEKGVATIELRAVGKGGHASAPGKELATTRIARAIGRLQRHPFRPQLSETGREMFEELSKHASGRARTLARVIARNPRLAARILASQGGEAAALVRTTVAVTMLSGGTAANVLPNGASATLNVRLAPSDTVASALEHIERVIAIPRLRSCSTKVMSRPRSRRAMGHSLSSFAQRSTPRILASRPCRMCRCQRRILGISIASPRRCTDSLRWKWMRRSAPASTALTSGSASPPWIAACCSIRR